MSGSLKSPLSQPLQSSSSNVDHPEEYLSINGVGTLFVSPLLDINPINVTLPKLTFVEQPNGSNTTSKIAIKPEPIWPSDSNAILSVKKERTEMNEWEALNQIADDEGSNEKKLNLESMRDWIQMHQTLEHQRSVLQASLHKFESSYSTWTAQEVLTWFDNVDCGTLKHSKSSEIQYFRQQLVVNGVDGGDIKNFNDCTLRLSGLKSDTDRRTIIRYLNRLLIHSTPSIQITFVPSAPAVIQSQRKSSNVIYKKPCLTHRACEGCHNKKKKCVPSTVKGVCKGCLKKGCPCTPRKDGRWNNKGRQNKGYSKEMRSMKRERSMSFEQNNVWQISAGRDSKRQRVSA